MALAAPAPGSGRFIAALVMAQVGVQTGAFTLPALLPGFMARWEMSATEAGWLVGVFYLAYVPAVPVLVALTDRLPARRIYLLGAGLTAVAHLGFALLAEGFWSALALRLLAGVGWAACYMPGLKALTDPVSGAAQSRAVSWHAAGVGIAGALSFAAAGLLDALSGPEAAFLFGAATAATAFGLAAWAMPDAAPAAAPSGRRLLDFRPVLRNRRAMAWVVGYGVHTWELTALRAWAVTFLAVTGARLGTPAWLPDPTVLFTLIGLACIAVSITGNELAQRLGRARIVHWAMLSAAGFALVTGWAAGASVLLALALLALWNAAIYLDSSALTAGTVQAADPALRGATMGLHSMVGYTGGFLGPVGVGLLLDLGDGDSALGWGLAFGHLALLSLGGLLVLRRLAPPLVRAG